MTAFIRKSSRSRNALSIQTLSRPQWSPIHSSAYCASRLTKRTERPSRELQHGGGKHHYDKAEPYTPPWPTSNSSVRYPFMGVEPPGSALGPSPSQPPLDESVCSVPVVIPHDPNSVIESGTGTAELLSNSALVVVRQLEPLNIFLGFEQANKYAVLNPNGEHVAYLAEEETFGNGITRQLLATSRPFRATVMNTRGEIIMRIRRPFTLINSRIFVHSGDTELPSNLIGLAEQQWHLWRRKYNLYLRREKDGDPSSLEQYAKIDSGFMSWDFYLQDQEDGLLGTVNRNFSGFAREIFTDTGQYALRFDAAQGQDQLDMQTSQHNKPVRGMTLDERAVAFATAISIDFDYFSRHSRSGGGLFPFYGMGGHDEQSPGAVEDGPISGPGEQPGLPVERPSGPSGGSGGMLPGMMAGGMYDDQYGARGQSTNGPNPESSPSASQYPSDFGTQDQPYDQDTWGEMNDPWASNESNNDGGNSWWGGENDGGSWWGGSDGGGDGGGDFFGGN